MTSIAARMLFASTVIAFGLPLSGNVARADVVTEWNVIALNATTIPPNSVLQSRTIAMVHAAIYDAANAVERKGGAYAVDLKAAPEHRSTPRLRPRPMAHLSGSFRRSARRSTPRSMRRSPGFPMGPERPMASGSASKSPKGWWCCAAATDRIQRSRSHQQRARAATSSRQGRLS